MEDAISKLQIALTKISKGNEKSVELNSWVRNIVDEKTGLVEKLVAAMIIQWGESKNSEYVKRSLQVFRYLPTY